MVRFLDAVDRSRLVDVVYDLDAFEHNYRRMSKFFRNMYYNLPAPKKALWFMAYFGDIFGSDLANYLIMRFDHLGYNNETIIIDERPFDDYINLTIKYANMPQEYLALEPSVHPLLLAKGEDGMFYLSIFVL